MRRDPWTVSPRGQTKGRALTIRERDLSRAERRAMHRCGLTRRIFASAPRAAHRSPLTTTETTTMNDPRNSIVLLALMAARSPQSPGDWPKSSDLDAIIRRARKGLVTSRNGLTKDRANPALVVATFDQVSHALTRFASQGVQSETVVRECAQSAARAVEGSGLAPDVVASSIETLMLDAAAALGLCAGSESEGESGAAAGPWLLRVAGEIARHAKPAAQRAAGVESKKGPSAERADAPRARTDEKETTPVKQNPALIETLKTDATDAAWRTAGSQFVKLTREPLVGLLTRHLAPGDDAFRAKIAVFLETELGAAIMASLLSAALSALPATAGEVPQKLARELRVRAMSDAGDVLADLLMGPLRQVMALYLQDPGGIAAPSAPPALPQGADADFDETAIRERAAVQR